MTSEWQPIETNCTTYGTPPHVMLIIYRLRALAEQLYPTAPAPTPLKEKKL